MIRSRGYSGSRAGGGVYDRVKGVYEGKGYSGEGGGGEEILVDGSEPTEGAGGEDGSRQTKPHKH